MWLYIFILDKHINIKRKRIKFISKTSYASVY
jgi:hypothetical protein